MNIKCTTTAYCFGKEAILLIAKWMNVHTSGSSPNSANNDLYVAEFEDVKNEAAAEHALVKTVEGCGLQLPDSSLERIFEKKETNEAVLTPRQS
jgi:hypothetical protein